MAEITVAQAYNAITKLRKQRTPQGEQRPELLSVKGSVGTKIYHLKKDIQDAFKAHFERVDDLLSDKQELFREIQDIDKEKSPERFSELESDVKELNEQIREIEKSTETIKFSKGKIPISKIEEQVAPEHWEDIDFAIDFDK